MKKYNHYTIDDAKAIANKKGGECLSTVYINIKMSLKWRCSKNHVWEAPLERVLYDNNWCPTCGRYSSAASRKLSTDSMFELAKNKNGTFLSINYLGTKVLHRWECESGHQFFMRPNDVRQGHWCPICSRVAKATIEEIQLIAKERDGNCLSTEYKNSRTALLFECKYGHTWSATPNNIKGSKNKIGSWCPLCNSNTMQELCRYIIEKLTGLNLQLTRKVLNNGLELDGYNEDKHFAFEYNGGQHNQLVPFFHNNNPAQFLAQKERDLKKIYICKKLGISLMVIPDATNVNFDNLLTLIFTELVANGIPIVIPLDKVLLDDFYRSRSKIQQIHKLVESHGGKLISTTYINKKSRIEVECASGHRWKTTATILANHWCKKCSDIENGKKRKLALSKLQEFAQTHGGKCLATEAANSGQPIKWECELGHIWLARPNDVLNKGTWCAICNKNRLKELAQSKRLGIEKMRIVAKARGGLCLSTEYINYDTMLDWQCRDRHIFRMTPHDVLSEKKHWCPYCAGLKKKTIEDMQTFAYERGGRCLSDECNGNKSPLYWECSRGHIFAGSYNKVSRLKNWCPKCGQELK